MAFDVLDDVLTHDLSLEAFGRAFEAFAINNLHFSQRDSPQFLKCYRRFSVAASFDAPIPADDRIKKIDQIVASMWIVAD
jgi:hypothetical protein